MNQILNTNKDIALIYSKYVDMVYRICFVLLKKQVDAEDATSNVFTKLMKINKEFDSEDHLKAYLIVMAKNTCKNYFSNYYNKYVQISDKIDIETKDEHTYELLDEISKLASKYRIVIYMYYYEGYNSAEIAEILAVKKSTIRTRLMIGREKLKSCLEGNYER